MPKDFINLNDFTGEQLGALLDRAIEEKKRFAAGKLPAGLQRKTLAMIFEKPSLRTRVSFEAAMVQLGGQAIYLTQADIGLGQREPVQDIARVLGRICNAICARTFSHEFVEQLGRNAAVPVINALSNHSHPCQAMADLMTIHEHFERLEGRTIAFIGDGNNVARSMAVACGKLGMRFVLACPGQYRLAESFTTTLPDGSYRQTADPLEAVAEADVIYTDTWVSMGQEDQRAQRQADFAGFQVNSNLLAKAPAGVMVLHCLPAYRGCEITDEAFEANAETIFAEAENRLHFQRALLNVLIGEGQIR